MGAEEKISVTLSGDLADTVRDAVAVGDFGTPEEAVLEALHLWQRQREREIARLRELVAEGDKGPFEPWEGAEVLKKKFRERLAKRDG